MLNIDGDQISIAIDLDQGARLASLQWRDMEFVKPFDGDILGWGWYAMAPFAGRIKDGQIKDNAGKVHQLPTTYLPPFAIHGLAFSSSWQDLGGGRQLLELPPPYQGASVIQHFEILDLALRWSLEYEAGKCDLPFSLGFHPWIARDIGKGSSAQLNFNANKMFERDNDYALSGKLITPITPPWDHTFTQISGEIELIWQGAARLTVESDSPYVHIYTEDEAGICIEPVTAAPNSQFNNTKSDNYIEALFTFSEDY
jgi:aldose 1-epimerase